MKRTVYAGLVLLGAVLATAVAFAGQPGGGTANAAKGHWLTPMQRRTMSGAAAAALERGPVAGRAQQLRSMHSAAALGQTAETGCPVDRGSNIRVNQNCENLSDPDLAGRAQAQNETAIAQDPNSPSRIVASSNDYRRGDGNCYTYYSGDGGRSWQDSTPPMSFTRGTAFGNKARQYWQAGGDTSVAWDTRGNAYLSCQMFNRGTGVSNNPDQSSAFYVFRSTGTGGASWNFPARPVAELNDTAGSGAALLDKQLLTVDDPTSSPFRARPHRT